MNLKKIIKELVTSKESNQQEIKKEKKILTASDWRKKLRTLYDDWEFKGLDYCYFSPIEENITEKKYPLIIYIHGLWHWWYKRSQLNNSYFEYMASKEIQSKFKEWWAHILLPRVPEKMPSVAYTKKVQDLINNFINIHINKIDTKQIFIMWSSAWWWMARRLLIQNPELYSKALITCANKIPTNNELKKVANKPIWIVSAMKDPIIPFPTQIITRNKLKTITKVPELCRFTVFDWDVYAPDFKKALNAHKLSKVITYDFEIIEQYKWTWKIKYNWENYPWATTETATNKPIPTKGIIKWLQSAQ